MLNNPPVVSCPGNISQPSDPNVCGAVVSFLATATGTPAPTITYSKNPGTVFPIGTTNVLVTATNTCGTSTCTFSVTVTGPSVSIAPVYAVPAPGGVANAIYKTYGPQSLNLTASFSGAANPVYSWSGPSISGATNGATINVAPTTPGTYTYTVTVNSASGCAVSATSLVKVYNISCGGNKVSLCQSSTTTTICVGPGWVPNYLANGYTLGACGSITGSNMITGDEVDFPVAESTPGTTANMDFRVTVDPNPTTTSFRLQVSTSGKDPVQLRIIDNTGRVLTVLNNVPVGFPVSIGGNFSAGLYFLEVIQGANRKVLKLVKL